MPIGEIISVSVSALVTIVTGIILFALKSNITELKKYRSEREKREAAKDDLILGMARVMLVDNYNRCEEKGFYSTEEREVYRKLFDSYRINGGNGVIDQLAPMLRSLPTKRNSGAPTNNDMKKG